MFLGVYYRRFKKKWPHEKNVFFSSWRSFQQYRNAAGKVSVIRFLSVRESTKLRLAKYIECTGRKPYTMVNKTIYVIRGTKSEQS